MIRGQKFQQNPQPNNINHSLPSIRQLVHLYSALLKPPHPETPNIFMLDTEFTNHTGKVYALLKVSDEGNKQAAGGREGHRLRKRRTTTRISNTTRKRTMTTVKNSNKNKNMI
jgi:hypothetical protein